jgi:hypothetical protein
MTIAASASPAPSRHLGRSIGAIVFGFVVVFVLSTGTDVVVHGTGVFPPLGERMSNESFVLASAYRVVIAIFGCYLAARLAPREPMRHALILGGIGTVAAIAGVVAAYNRPDMGPNWYPILLVVTALPCAYLGGLLDRQRRS